MILSKTFLVTHKNCMDGSVCAAVFMAAGGKRENIYFCNAGHTDGFVLDLIDDGWKNPIIIADLHVTLDMAEYINKNTRNSIVLLDHHNSSLNLTKFGFCIIDVKNERCGSKMLFDWICNYYSDSVAVKIFPYKDLILLVDDNDRWIHNFHLSQDLASLHKLVGQEAFLDRIVKNPKPEFTEKERYLVDFYNKKRATDVEIRKSNTQIYQKRIQGHDVRVGVVMAEGDDQSFLGNSICEDLNLDVDIAVIINGLGVSLRGSSDCPVDLSKVAKLNGGGGHIKASGCSLSEVLGQDFLELVMNKMKF